MKLIDYIEDEIPTYALSYLVTGDASGIEDEDKANTDEWYDGCTARLSKQYPGATIDLWTEDGEGGFTRSPAFGLACDCITGAVVALVNNSDPRPEIAMPEFLQNDDDEEI